MRSPPIADQCQFSFVLLAPTKLNVQEITACAPIKSACKIYAASYT